VLFPAFNDVAPAQVLCNPIGSAESMRVFRSLCLLTLVVGVAGCGNETADDSAPPVAAISPKAKDETGSSPAAESLFDVRDGFTSLTLADFSFVAEGPRVDATASPWTETGNVLRCTGTPRGYLQTKESLPERFAIRCDYRFLPEHAAPAGDPDTGFLLFVTGPQRIWPASLEVEGAYGGMGGLKSHAADVELSADDDASARIASRKPLGEWNTIEIIARDGVVTTSINGAQVARGKASGLHAGRAAIQSNGAAFAIRNFRIQLD
jgi:hypothetical protein